MEVPAEREILQRLSVHLPKAPKVQAIRSQSFFLNGMNIHGCRGCFGGHSSKACPCVQKDDMDQIYPEVKDCDIVVIASPLYYWNLSGQIRTAFDRLFALEEGNGDVGDIQGKPELEQAYSLGKSIE